ncbi:MAG: hypothetical protein A2Z27_05450 [candidate division Zixibacteria bacterium RBG_16_50_21]|nr:MAG: hypothetical protein A2Z27_05450 [candidate division Zixibacteria bacterium RBG_16_50_21]
MRKLTLTLSLILILGSLVGGETNLLKFFEGEWEGTVKEFEASGKEIQKFRARRILILVHPDTLRGTFQYFGANIESRPVPMEIIQNGKEFILRRAGLSFSGTYKDKTFTFEGLDENQVRIWQRHSFVGGDLQYFTLEQLDSHHDRKFTCIRGVLKLKKE